MGTGTFLVSITAVLLYSICFAEAVDVGESCMSMDECPMNSTCTQRGCDGMVCICDDGFHPLEDSSECKMVVDLDGSCASDTTVCSAANSHCTPDTKECKCQQGYTPASDNLRCKPEPIGSTRFALLGEACVSDNGDRIRCTGPLQDCDKTQFQPTCACISPDYRPASEEEKQAEPFVTVECREANYSLGAPVEDLNCADPEPDAYSDIDETCVSDNNCPVNSACKPRGCDGNVCVCNPTYFPTADKTTCLTARNLFQSCSGNDTVCVFNGTRTKCNDQFECDCADGFENRNNRCRRETRVVSPTFVIKYSLLDENCGNQRSGGVTYSFRCDDDLTDCIDGTCKCFEGLRPRTEEELANDPEPFSDCVDQNFTLVVSAEDCDVPLELPTPTTTPAEPTTTPAEPTTTPAEPTTTPPAPTTTTTPPAPTTTKAETTTTPAAPTTTPPAPTTTSPAPITTPPAPTTTTPPAPTTTPPAPTTTPPAPTTTEKAVQLVDLHTACDPENDTQVCPDSSTCRIFGCSAHVCTCDNGTSPNAMEDKCVRPAEIGDQCDEGNRCVGFRVSCIRGLCGCGEGLEAVENSCAVRYEGFAPKLLGQSCMNRTDCDQSYFVDCVDEKCQCDRAIGFREPTNDERYLQPTYTNAFQCRSDALSLDRVDKSCSTVKTVLVGDVCCELLTKCPDNATPSNSSCDDGGNLRCRCDHGYAPNSDNTKCLPLVELGESCGETLAVCRGSPSVLRCDSNTEKCICGQDLVVSDPNAVHKWCVPEPAGILVSRSLGEECSMSFMTTSFKVCSRDYEQNCVEGVCTCRTAFNLSQATPYEIYEDYTSDRQCRPDSSVNGTRTDWCHDAQPLVDQEAIDSQERMLFLHRTLPILLGGVAFSILLIVGFVVYRRRKRARAMAQRDDISMSSFGSSGSESPLDDNDVLRRVGRFRDDRNWMMNSQHFNPTTR